MLLSLGVLAGNALVSAALFFLLWRIAIRIQDVTFIDAYWALGMVALAIASFLETGPPTPHKVALLLLCSLWGLRLCVYLLWRWRTKGPDRRYRTMLGRAETERGWGFAKSSLLLVFAVQAPLQFVVCLPVQLGQALSGSIPFGPAGFVGAALFAVGFTFEAIGDLQLTRFKADPANKGKLLTTGLWALTRHPNYFGDACVWWGLYLIAAETPYGVWSLPGPVLLTTLLTRWSGVPTVEGRMRRTRPEYAAYAARTSGFIPWFPKPAVDASAKGEP